MLEFEKKALLTELEYIFLRDHGHFYGESSVQINHYYDTDDFELSKKGITCRIREKNGKFTATIKEHETEYKNCSVENSRQVGGKWDDSMFRAMGLKYQGSLETNRIICERYPGVKIMLDRNKYLGTEDYELEIEYDPDSEVRADAELRAISKQLFFLGGFLGQRSFDTRIGKAPSKSSRFFQRKESYNEI